MQKTDNQCHPKRASKPLSRFLAPLLIAGTLGMQSCVSRDQWTFSVSRAAYGNDWVGGDSCDRVYFDFGSGCSREAGVCVLIIMLLPVAIDIVLLPITLTHDLCD